MNEKIRQLADEADKWSQTMTWSSDPKYGDRPVSDLFNEKFAKLVAAHEREECAKVAENIVSNLGYVQSKHSAAAIRARGEK